ncbi:MAG: hypothetical protein WCZ23_13175 [Rhodospirillaceae bacterium]
MKKVLGGMAAGIFIGMAMGAGLAVAAGGPPVIQGIIGSVQDMPMYQMFLPARTALYVGPCPPGHVMKSAPGSASVMMYCE